MGQNILSLVLQKKFVHHRTMKKLYLQRKPFLTLGILYLPPVVPIMIGWILTGSVNNPFVCVNTSVLLSQVIEIQFELIDKNDVLKYDLNKVWFDLKDTKTDSESDCFDFKGKGKHNIH